MDQAPRAYVRSHPAMFMESDPLTAMKKLLGIAIEAYPQFDGYPMNIQVGRNGMFSSK